MPVAFGALPDVGLAFVESYGRLPPHSALSRCLAMFMVRASDWTYSCLRRETALSPEQGRCECAYTTANFNLKRPLAVLGVGPGRPHASLGFGVCSPGIRWTACARWQSSENHSAPIIISSPSRSGSAPQADTKEA